MADCSLAAKPVRCDITGVKMGLASRARISGISLPEAMVLVVLVVALIAVLIPALSSARTSGPRTKAPHTVRNIVNASRAYLEDHGKYPRVAEPRTSSEQFIFVGDAAAGCRESNRVLFDVLRAIPRGPNANHALNPKRAKYFEDAAVENSQQPRNGFTDGNAFPEPLQGCLVDPWGSQYCIVLETDDDERLDLGSIYPDLAGHAIRGKAAAISLGKNRHLGGEGYRGFYRRANSGVAPEDDVSFQAP